MENTNQIELKDVKKIYNRGKENEVVALNNISLTINSGDSLAIMGVSGSGKTTLLNSIGCIDSFTSGDYFLKGMNIKRFNDAELAEIRSNYIGYILQEYGLLYRDSVLDNVILPLCFSSKYKTLKERKARAKACLEEVGLLDKIKEKVINLSGGQKQRVAIARAIVNNPEIILADEPTGALDSKTKEEIMDILIRLNNEGKTVIVVTHDKEVAERMNKTIEIYDGKIRCKNIGNKSVNSL